MRELADYYRAFHFNIIPLGGDKRPIMTGMSDTGQVFRFKWEDFKEAPQSNMVYKALRSKPFWQDVQGVATTCGAGSGGLVCIDFDSHRKHDADAPPVDRAVVDAFLADLGLPTDYAWTVATPTGGWHVWLLCPDLALPKAKLDRPGVDPTVDHVELRYTGSYVVLPGSHHPDGGIYEFAHERPEAPPERVSPDTLETAYSAVTVEVVQTPTRTAGTHTAPLRVGAGTPYGLAALAAEADAVRNAPDGERNKQLNKSAFALGQLIPHELDEFTVHSSLFDAARLCRLMDGEILATIASGFEAGQKDLRYPESTISYNGNGASYTHGFDAETPDPLDADAEEKVDTWPYTVYKDRICIIQEDKDDGTVYNPIADFYTVVTEEIHEEDGEIEYVLHGKSAHGGLFTVNVGAHVFGKDNELRATLEAASGPQDPVRPRMTPHLGPAIKLLSRTQKIIQRKRYRRTGWANNRFLLPDRTDETTLIDLPRKLPYGGELGEIDKGIEALRSLLESITAQRSAPIFAMLLQAPMHRIANWHNERYAIFVQGRTGSLKTSFAQTAMCLYGAGFSRDDLLIKWGEGATRNAIMAMAAHAHDMPLLIDNYKPNTGGGARDFVNLIHNILEGGDKDRLTRSAMLRETKPVHVFPLVTGEDVPDEDPASLARVLVISLEWQKGQPNEALSRAQTLAEHLPAVGESWIAWLESDEGQAQVTKFSAKLPDTRARWATVLQSRHAQAVNVLRIATNLATNELTWLLACEHPIIGQLLSDYTHEHYEGLMEIAEVLAERTSLSLEAQQFASALRELLTTRQYILIHRSKDEPMDLDRDRMLGWYDQDGLYLLPKITLKAIKYLLGLGSLPISPQALYSQMESLGWLAVTGNDSTVKVMRIADRTVRVLHLSPAILDEESGIDIVQELYGDLGI